MLPAFLVLFFYYKLQNQFSVIMSQDLRSGRGEHRDISRTATDGSNRKNYEGFEGMNYEQIRQPYNPKHKARNNSTEERKETGSPDGS
jgi:hypothetical protein